MEQVTATATRHTDGTWILRIESCPFCHKPHKHGGGMGAAPSGGWRLSHCRENAQQYQIVLATTTVTQPEARSVAQ